MAAIDLPNVFSPAVQIHLQFVRLVTFLCRFEESKSVQDVHTSAAVQVLNVLKGN